MYADEVAGTGRPLHNINMEMRDTVGRLIQSKRTNAGAYDFPTPMAGKSFISINVGRNQASSPNSCSAEAGDQCDFRLRGVPSIVRITGPAGSFVVLNKDTALVGDPPQVVASGTHPKFVSGSISLDGFVDLSVTHGEYFLTCWTVDSQNVYRRVPTSGGNSLTGGIIEPQTANITRACP